MLGGATGGVSAGGPPLAAPDATAAAGGFTVGAEPPAKAGAGAAIVALNVDDRELGSTASADGAALVVRETTFGAPGKLPIATVAVLLLATGSTAAVTSGGGASADATARAVVVGVLPAASA